MRTLKNFHYQIYGQQGAKKLVFLHGLMGAGANWRRIVKPFEDDFEILCFDQRGHGRSFQPISGYTPQDYAEDLHFILEELNWSDPIHLVGHSMGGRNAVMFANEYPERLEKLVIEDIGPEANLSGLERIRGYLEAIPVPFSTKASAKSYLNHEFIEYLGGLNPQTKTLSQYFYTNLTQKDDGTVGWRFSRSGIIESMESARYIDWWEIWKNIEVPTLVVRGERSEELTPEELNSIAEMGENFKTETILSSGHWVHFEQPDRFIQVLKDFFDK